MSRRASITDKQIISVVRYLKRHGLSIYGQHVDLSTGEINDGCRDYTAPNVIRYLKHSRAHTLYRKDYF